MSYDSQDRVRRLISRTIEGVEALVASESGEIFMDVPAENPQYIRVGEGDTVLEGDIRTRRESELEAPSLRRWTIETIGSETVVGTDQESGERHEWDRESLERRLAIGGLSVTLADFDRVNVMGTSENATRGGRQDGRTVTVAVYGNNGQKFTQTYRPDDGGSSSDDRRVELVDTDERVVAFEPGLRERFDRVVEEALRDEGYSV